MSIQELEQKLNSEKANIGLVGGRLKLQEASDADTPISAEIYPSDWHLEITLKQGYNPVRDKRTAAYARKRRIPDALEKICMDVMHHEVGHWELPRGTGKGCPYDEANHDIIVEEVSKVLKKYRKDDLTGYVANAFEDIIVNINCNRYTDHSGQVLFWNEQGMENGKYNKFYEAFVRINLSLWGENIDNALVKRWHKNESSSISAADNVLSGWNARKGKENLDYNVERLYRKEDWPVLARIFAENMANLLDEPQVHVMFGATAQGQEKDKNSKKGQGSGNGSKKEGSAFDKKLDSPEGKEKAAYSRYTSGKGPAANRDSFEQLDSLYRRLAREIMVEIAVFSEAYTFPLAPWGKERFDPEQHDLLQRKVRIGIDEDGNIGLDVNRGWIETKEVYKRNISKFPKFRFAILDTSGSMKYNPDNETDSNGNPRNIGSTVFIPWGDNSKYHYALLGHYGVERYMQRQHIAPYVSAGVINFSSETKSGKGTDARKLMLEPQFGGTTLDIEVLQKEIKDSETFLLSLSDGDIQNWGSIRDEYKSIATKCAAAHIQIGAKNKFSEDLESWGIPVYYVKGNKDLAKLMVKVASDKYKSYAMVRQ